MRKFFSTAMASVLLSGFTFAQLNPVILPVKSSRKIQVAILFDTSGSMNGLIEQAKSRIWSIINEMNALRYQGEIPTIEIALYDYGNSALTSGSQFIRQQVPLTTDLDLLSQKLFALTASGSEEYCGAVIQKSLNDLKWSDHPHDLKLIYIAGNEPFNQGSVPYKEACANAAGRTIFVNTIYCGEEQQGIREFWKDCAVIAHGSYFNINANQATVHIETPYDQQINQYNDSLNATYYGYGSLGQMNKQNQFSQDFNAEKQSKSVKTERAVAKSSLNYTNSSWDIVDAAKDGKDVNTLKEAELPQQFKGKTPEQKTALVIETTANRERYQQKIGQLAKERQAYIDAETKKLSGAIQNDFGSSVKASLVKIAKEIGFE